MSEVRFVIDADQAVALGHPDEAIVVDYAFGDFRCPVVGEYVAAEGDDPAFPAGIYEVTHVDHIVRLRGPHRQVCALRYVAPLRTRIGGSDVDA